MKKTNEYIKNLKPETIEKRRIGSADFYNKNKTTLLLKAKIRYFKKKYPSNVVDEYVAKYGLIDAVTKIKDNVSKILDNCDNKIGEC
jgi:hypothetical protein